MGLLYQGMGFCTCSACIIESMGRDRLATETCNYDGHALLCMHGVKLTRIHFVFLGIWLYVCGREGVAHGLC